jgi:predicted Fe-Mo cluster-binding NifX family protein
MVTKIAIPTFQDEFSSHFGHCEKFAIYNIENGKIQKQEFVNPPTHTPGSHPRFLKELGCHVIIAGGIGMKAQEIFQNSGIKTIIGVEQQPLNQIIEKYIAGELESGKNCCDH